MQQYIDSGDQFKQYERKGQKKTSLFYKQALEEKEEFHKYYEKEVDKLQIFETKPELKEFITHFEERNSRFYHRLDRILQLEQSLKDYAKGYLKYGVIIQDEGIIYREWAPEAQAVSIIGEFNGWNPQQHQCTKMEQEWVVHVEQQNIKSKYLIQVNNNQKISCWTKQLTIEDNKFLGIIPEEQYEFLHFPLIQKPQKFVALNYQEDITQDTINNLQDYDCVLLKNVISNIEGKVIAYLALQGKPHKLKQLIDYIHSKNMSVIIDFPLEVHHESPIVNWDGSTYHYVVQGTAQPHIDFENWESNRYLLSALSYWMNEYKIDGYHFPNLNKVIQTQQVDQQTQKHLLIDNSNIDGLIFVMFANDLIHRINENAITVGSQIPELYPCHTTIKLGGIGLDYSNIKIDQQ